MRLLRQFLIIACITFAGEVFHHFLPLPVPASIYGIVLLFFLLLSGVLRLGAVEDAASFLIEIMPVMFIPAVAGLMDSFHLILPSLFAYLAIMTLSTFAVMIVSGRVCQAMLAKKEKKEDDAHA